MDTGKLVAEIEKRPVLYDTRVAHTSAKELKPRMWLEVAAHTVSGWETLSNDQRQKIVTDIQKRWRTLRDNFKRELKYQKSLETGAVATKRRKYKHYDLLQFLEPVMERNSSHRRTKIEYGEEMMAEDITVTLNEDTMASVEGQEGVFGEMYRRSLYEENYSEQERIPYLAQFDPDEMYFVSLLPSFRRLSEEQKSLAKVRIAQVIHDISYPEAKQAPPATTHSIGPIVIKCEHKSE